MFAFGVGAAVGGAAGCFYAAFVGTLVVDTADAAHVAAIEVEGVRCVVTPTVMSTPERAAALGQVVVDAVS